MLTAGQLGTGALSDRIGRKWLIAAGMGVQAVAIGLVALGTTFTAWAVAAVLLGVGTAVVYPTLLAAIWAVAALTAVSGIVVAIRMYETKPAHPHLAPAR